MRIMKKPEGTNICQKFYSSSGKLYLCNSQDDIDSILFVVSKASIGTSLGDGIGSDAGTGSDTGISSEAGTLVKAGIGSDAGTGSDSGIRGNNSLGNSTETMSPVMIVLPLLLSPFFAYYFSLVVKEISCLLLPHKVFSARYSLH
jgi:hypothetical protein